MSILIKGIEMPPSCWECWFQDCGNCVLNKHKVVDKCILEGRRDEDCPLIPVLDHGRLIDADAYEALIRGLGNREYRREHGTICDAIKFLHPHYAPTIIPAEEQVYDKYTDTAGNLHWTGTHSGKHIFPAEQEEKK